jgi:hypothetical protein
MPAMGTPSGSPARRGSRVPTTPGRVGHALRAAARAARRTARSSSSSQPRVLQVRSSSVRDALVTSVAWAPPVSLPQQPAVDRAEGQLAARGLRAGASPARGRAASDLGAGEVRVERAGRCARARAPRGRGAQPGAGVGGAAVLPDDGAVQRAAGRAVPQHGGLALVGDADGAPRPARRLDAIRAWCAATICLPRFAPIHARSDNRPPAR